MKSIFTDEAKRIGGIKCCFQGVVQPPTLPGLLATAQTSVTWLSLAHFDHPNQYRGH